EALTERTSREAATAKRANEAESNLASLKRSYRELRMQARRMAALSSSPPLHSSRSMQVAAINLKRTSAATQTETHLPTGTAVQTDWQVLTPRPFAGLFVFAPF
ncbi:MAG: hypothetical protein SGPRY_010815, partial [Prymnesium sp.]